MIDNNIEIVCQNSPNKKKKCKNRDIKCLRNRTIQLQKKTIRKLKDNNIL